MKITRGSTVTGAAITLLIGGLLYLFGGEIFRTFSIGMIAGSLWLALAVILVDSLWGRRGKR